MKLKSRPQPLPIMTSYTPLVTKFGIITEGGSKTQFYYANAFQYIPSRSVTPLLLKAYLHIVDPDGLITNGEKTSKLTVYWFEGSYDNQITTETEGYTLNSDGTLTVTKDVSPESPIQILVRAQFTDTRWNRIMVFEDRANLTSIRKTDTVVNITLDQPTKIIYNPLKKDSSIININADLRLGKSVIAAEKCKYWWYIVNNGVETLIDLSDTALEYVSGQGTKSLQINADYTNFSLIRVKGEYLDLWDEEPTAPSADSPTADISILFQLPEVAAHIYSPNGSTLRSSETSKTFICRLSTNQEILTNEQISKYYLIKWYRRPIVAGSSRIHVADGPSINIKAADLKMTGRNAMNVYPEIYVRGAMGIITNSAGAAVTSESGAVIISRT